MPESTRQFRSGSALRDVVALRLPGLGGDPSLVGALKVMVRRILRTQDGRTGFPARVLEQARVVRDNHGGELERETFERLIVDQLLCARRDGQFQLAALGPLPACPSTWERLFEATFRAAVPALRKDAPCEKINRNDPRR